MVFGVSVDPVEANKAFKRKAGLPFELLSDQDRSMSLAFGAAKDKRDQYAQRYTFVIGIDGKIEQAITTKDPAGQAGELLS